MYIFYFMLLRIELIFIPFIQNCCLIYKSYIIIPFICNKLKIFMQNKKKIQSQSVADNYTPATCCHLWRLRVVYTAFFIKYFLLAPKSNCYSFFCYNCFANLAKNKSFLIFLDFLFCESIK